MNSPDAQRQSEGKIAIIGMACLFPGAPDLPAFWSNIVRGADSIRQVSDREWNAADYYDPDATAFGLSYSRRGGFITEFADFDPLKYGVMPSTVAGSDPDQWLALRVAHEAMADAGYLSRTFDRDRAEIILGRISAPGAGSMNLIQQSKTVKEISSILSGILPDQDSKLLTAVAVQLQERLIPCSSDTIPGTMPNVLAGRIAAKLGFRGRNLLVDAACASSMVAVEIAVHDLLAGRCDLALAGGVHVNSSAVMFQMFCGLGALSRSDEIRPFDEHADGTLLGEGVGIICLKRYEDAIAAGDRIYATICGVASSSDGHGGGALAPSLDGEALAMRNAYAMAGISPSTIELLEGHGTGTPAGDVVELQAVARVFNEHEAAANDKPWCALGSVKSMIGHCQSASAVAGIIKAALALHHRILPPTLNVSTPNPKIDWTAHPCYVNTRSRPWIHARNIEHPRRAAVSAFGFGGINGHLILEEHAGGGDSSELDRTDLTHVWESELFTFCTETRQALLDALAQLAAYLEQNPNPNLKDLAYTLNCERNRQSTSGYRLALVASSAEDLSRALSYCAAALTDPSKTSIQEAEKGIYFTAPGASVGGKLAFLYPGLGSAYTNMLSDLAVYFPEVRAVFEIVDTVATAAGESLPPSKMIFPTRKVNGQGGESQSLASADFAVVAVLLAEYALYELLRHLEITPDVLMGCSTGEFAAITTGGAVDVLSAAETFYALSTRVARSIASRHTTDLRSLRILASSARVSSLIADEDAHLVADLGDDHITVTGSKEGIESLTAKLARDRIACHPLPAAIPYHTPLVKTLVDENDDAVKSVQVRSLLVPAWSCSTADIYPEDVNAIRASFTELFCKPVQLRQTIRAMYDQGVRKFVEVGPNGVLTSLVEGILSDKPHVAVPTNLASRPALAQVHHLLAVLFTQGVPAKFDFLYQRRIPVCVDWQSPSGSGSNRSGSLLPLAHASLGIVPELPSNVSVGYVVDNPATDSCGSSGEDGFSEEAVLQSFLSTNASFYSRMTAVQEQVMTAFLSQEAGPDYAFLNRATIVSNGASTEMYLSVDLNTDLYLLDHAIGGFVSSCRGVKVHVMPVMVSLEIMAQAALAHMQSGVLVRIEQVKAFKRIVVDAEGLTLRAVVTGTDSPVHVELYEGADSDRAVMVADFVFGAGYPQPVEPELSVTGKAPTKLTERSSLYGRSAMFHGPRMQSVLSVDTIGNRAIAGCADAGEATGWMPDTLSARFLLHPLLLDNASQFVLFYLYENDLPATALLPFFIESIDFNASPDYLTRNVAVSATLPVLSERSTEAVVEIVDSDGTLWSKINNINSRRIILSDEWAELVADPLNSRLGTIVPTSDRIGTTSTIVQVSQAVLPHDDSTLEWCLDYLLTRTEREWWRDTSRTEKRRIDWLLGRIAAKESIRTLVRDSLGRALGPHDVEIIYQAEHCPAVRIIGDAQLPPIAVSISHTDGLGVALAALSGAGYPGIDAEIIREREPDFAGSFLQPGELRYLDWCSEALKNTEMTRIWSAKEALFKAFGGSVRLTGMEATGITPGQDLILMTAVTGSGPFKIYSKATDNLVLAYTLAELAD